MKNLTDEQTVEEIIENAYMQYFLGLEGFCNSAPFDETMMVHFRKRISADMLSRINERIVERQLEVEAAQPKQTPKRKTGETDDDQDHPSQDAGQIDTLMPHRMTVKIATALNRHKKPINGSKILFLEVAYKPDIADERESPALKIMDEIAHKGGMVSFYDPYINTIRTPEGRDFSRIEYSSGELRDFDCVVITTKHSQFDGEEIEQNAEIVVDMRNLIDNESSVVTKL